MPDIEGAAKAQAEGAALDAVFSPRAIVVLGASTDPKKFGHRIVRNLKQGGFPGEVFPVSRSAPDIAGYRSVSGTGEIPRNIDLALISIPARDVAQAISDAAAKGAKAAVIFSSGFAEEGPAGRALQEAVVAAARKASVRVIGPNCMGVRNFHLGMNASPAGVPAPGPGSVAMISQSGALGSAACLAMRAAGLGLSKLASIGNMADIRSDELIRYFGDDPQTAVIAAFLEGSREAEKLLDAIADVSRRKPVVVLKGGRSELGARAALSHTSSLAGGGRIWMSLLREAGATVVDGIEELFDAAGAFARLGDRLPLGRRVAIFTVAGGPAVVASDHCAAHGLEMPELDSALADVRPLVPPYASLRNPIDIAGSSSPSSFTACLDALASREAADIVLGLGIGVDVAQYADGLAAARKQLPVVASLVSAPNAEAVLAEANVPNLPSAERAVRAIRHLVDRGTTPPPKRDAQPPARLPAEPPPLNSTEAEAKAYLRALGLPTTREQTARNAADAAAVAQSIGYPVALKVSSAAIAHKTERGGVILNIAGPEELAAACATLAERFPGADVLVQEMAPPGVELIVGAQRMPETGPVVMVGFGGIFTEILDDVVFARAPVSHAAALSALGRLRTQKLLDGYRNLPRVDRDAVARILTGIGALMAEIPAIGEIDLNPVIATASGPRIVDALILGSRRE